MQKVHFIGIGGIGVSALAQIYLHQGNQISGSDQKSSDLIEKLQQSGAKIQIGHSETNISDQDLVIYSPAIPPDNPELLAAREKGIECLSYPQALGRFSEDYFTIAIAGTHGKSTTTAMTALSLTAAGLDPTVIIGTKVFEFNNQNYRVGKSKILVIEACEYRDSFLNFHPDILAITNIEPDHLDYFKTAENYYKTFQNFAAQIKPNGHVIRTEELQIQPLNLKVPGEFNIKNANLALKIGKILNIDQTKQIQTLENFRGTWRRMEFRGCKGNTDFYDDYAHHPTEIRATLRAFREKYEPEAKILTIFQPHQYSRTIELFDDFAKSFEDTTEVIIPNIYRVRDSESDIAKISAQTLAEKINEVEKQRIDEIQGNKERTPEPYNNIRRQESSAVDAGDRDSLLFLKAKDGGGLEATKQWLSTHYQNYDLVITMGAGDVNQAIKNLGQIHQH